MSATDDALWERIWAEACKLDIDVDFKRSGSGRFLQMYYRGFDDTNLHYEWLLRGASQLDIALHSEYESRSASHSVLKPLKAHEHEIGRGISYPFEICDFGEKSAQARFILSCQDLNDPSMPATAASLMKVLVTRTWPLIRPDFPLTDIDAND